jgi:uncharacterized membrane protein
VRTTMRVGLCLASALVFWSPRVGASLAADSYSMTTIDYPDARATFASGINNRGDIVGSYRIPGTRHAMLIRSGVFIALPPASILLTNWSEASKSNDRGDLVGRFMDDDGVFHGFLASGRDYALRTLDFPGAGDTQPRAINESGTVVGFWYRLEDDTYHGFIWNKGEFSEVNFPGAIHTFLTGINSRGDIVGSWQTESNIHGFVFSQGQFLSLDAPFPDTDTEPTDINDLGHVVGAYYNESGTHGFLVAGETFATIDYPGAARTAVSGINSAGQIVGTHADSPGGPNRGFLGQPGNKKKP